MHFVRTFLNGLCLLLLTAALFLSGCEKAKGTPGPQHPTSGTENPGAHSPDANNPDMLSTKEMIERLEVVSPESGKGFSRAKFGLGDGWPDVDGDGCNTRNEILRRDLSDPRFWEGRNTPPNCVVSSGNLVDPYTNKHIVFDRENNHNAIQIDHVVALYDAWIKGAQHWSPEKRTQFANDEWNLLAVSAEANKDKGHDDASRWLPVNKDFTCEYVERQALMKYKYQLGVTKKERSKMFEVAKNCGL